MVTSPGLGSGSIVAARVPRSGGASLLSPADGTDAAASVTAGTG